MTEAIKKWITNSIGIVMNMTPNIFAAEVMDGTIIAKILHSYNIISNDQLLKVLQTDNPALALKNLKRIGLWLKTVGITCKDNDLLDISMAKSLVSIKLFYELYLTLHDKHKLHFTAKMRGNQMLHPSDTRFEVTPVNDQNFKILGFTDHPYSKQLVEQQDIIEWNQNRYQTLVDNYEKMRKIYAKHTEHKFGVSDKNKFHKISKPVSQSETTDLPEMESVRSEGFTFEELRQEQLAATEKEKFAEDPIVTRNIVKKLKRKRRQEVRENAIKINQQKVLLRELWNKLLIDQEREFDNIISSKLMKQSTFEKQMVTKMLEVRQQKHNMLQNRKFVDDETLKKREEEFLEHVFMREKSVEDQKSNYYFERDRILELHRRIYAERRRLNTERSYLMCKNVVKDMVDVSIRHHEYKEKYKVDVSKRVHKEWTNLFIQQQPIFDVMSNVEEVIIDTSDLFENEEEIYCLEIHRQDELDRRDFENYANFEWPWQLDDLLTNYEDNLVPIERGMNVLGHNVHRVLLTKYPKPRPVFQPDLVKVKVTACINGIPNLTILPLLQKLLVKKKIKVIEIQDAINYCLEVYKSETSAEYLDNVLMSETNSALAELHGTGKDKRKKLHKGNAKKRVNEQSDSQSDLQKVSDKTCQTPKVYPCEEMVLSAAGELGKTAYDLLNMGEQLANNLVMAMFFEYVKSLKDIEGWALINYPVNFDEAAILEETFTGIPVPRTRNKLDREESNDGIGDMADLEYRKSRLEQEERNAKLRRSRLLPDPDAPPIETPYNTYLTAYVKAQPKKPTISTNKNAFSENGETETTDVKGEIDELEQFYWDQGCNYTFSYDTFDFENVKRLAKLIVGEFTIPPKTSVELFGETVLFVESSLGKPGGGALKKELKCSATSRSSVAADSVSESSDSKSTEAPVPPGVGETLWRYNDVRFPDCLQIALGTLWENLETVYVRDFKKLFFIKRTILNTIVPYLTYVKEHMDIYLARPDNKQRHMHQFQMLYNEIDADMRDDDEVKAEIHCRIAEFREKMCEICDKRMKESENERQRIIRDNWLPYQAFELINNCLNGMQLEIDRCCDSLQFLTDYYYGVATKMPSNEPPLQKFVITQMDTSESKIGVAPTVSADVFRDATISILTVPGSVSTETPFHKIIETNLPIVHSAVDKFKTTSSTLVSKLDSMLKPGKKFASSARKGEKALPKFEGPEPDVSGAAVQLIEEFGCAVQGEYLRAKLRLNAVAERGLRDLNDVLSSCQKAFYGIYDDIAARYRREIASVNAACEILAHATESEVPLQAEMVLDDDRFYIEPDVLLFPEPLPVHDFGPKEATAEGTFTVEQLDVLVDVLAKMAPSSIVPERTFVFLLQDMIVQNAEDGKGPMVPSQWQQLMPKQVSELSRRLFGSVEFVDWRDFVIYNLCVRFPSEEELMLVRKQFRDNDPDDTETVKDYQFYDVDLWFQKDFDRSSSKEVFRLKSIKALIFKMFKINEDTFNYTAFLLSFCKDTDPMLGFAKALCLVFGRSVCRNVTVGSIYLKSVTEQRYLDKRAELDEKFMCEKLKKEATSLIDSLISTTVRTCDNVVIEDLDEQIGRNSATAVTAIFNRELEKKEEFPKADVGFEPSYTKSGVYFLPFESVLAVLTAALPWQAKAQTAGDKSLREKLEVIYRKLRRPEFNGSVFSHELLHDCCFLNLLTVSFKFMDKCPPKIVGNIIEEGGECS